MTSAPALVVEADDVSKKFRLFHERNTSLKATLLRGRRVVVEDFWALRGVSFGVAEGETFGLIGENGSGKSTMLKCLTKILRPDGGSVRVDGKVSALLELGAGFHPELSGRENVFLNGAILGMSQKELRRRFDEIVDFAGIEQFIDEPVKNYSSGMYVRLGFSVAINVDPDVLLVDEVLAVGDEGFQRKCNEKFADMKRAGKTIVLVSHGLEGVQTMCDRVAWFSHGQLIQIGDPRQVIEAYTDTVDVGRRPNEDEAGRWGAGEGRITEATFLDRSDAPTTRVFSGEQARLRMRYEMQNAIERPVFGFKIYTLEGFCVAGTNTREAECTPEKLDGTGEVTVTFDPLTLLPGTYDLTLDLVDYHGLHTYDHRPNLVRFDVERGPITATAGVVSLEGRWQVDHEGS